MRRVFFKLLWRHVFAVEIIRRRFQTDNSTSPYTLLERIGEYVKRDKSHKRALEYLKNWGSSFWEETDFRIKEVTTTLETNLKAAIHAGIPSLSNTELNSEAARRLTEQEKREVVTRAQTVVNSIQIKELSEVIELIATILEDPQKQYYILIDRLDENWIEEKLRYRLIRALIETARDFQKVRNAKIVIAIRLDLLDRVFRLTRDDGFQQEKYDSLLLRLQWTRPQLIKVLDLRIGLLFRKRYETSAATHKDVLPQRILKQDTLDYLLDRTFERPRDIIVFFNECIQKAVDLQRISAQKIKDAEGEYSRNRLRSLADEWSSDYPNLLNFTNLLQRKREKFLVSDLSLVDIEELCLKFCIQEPGSKDSLSLSAFEVAECHISAHEFRQRLVYYYYKVGLIGIKLQHHLPVSWALPDRRAISWSEIRDDCSISVHPMFWRVLGVSN